MNELTVVVFAIVLMVLWCVVGALITQHNELRRWRGWANYELGRMIHRHAVEDNDEGDEADYWKEEA